MPDKTRVLMLSPGNSARSQMAEGLLRHDGGATFEVHSAGTRASFVRPEAIAAMRESKRLASAAVRRLPGVVLIIAGVKFIFT